MPVSNGIITAPVSIDDVHDALGESSYDLGTLCMSQKINRWARFKPEDIDTQLDLIDLSRKTNNFSLSLPTLHSSRATLVAALKSGAVSWTYRHPTSAMRTRLNDFDGYDHNALPPFGTIQAQDVMLSDGPVIDCVYPVSGGGSLSLADFEGSVDSNVPPLSQWYFAVLLYNGQGEWIASAAHTFAEGNAWQVDFNGSRGLKTGTYTAVPFISSVRWIPGGSVPANDTFVACGIESTAVTIHILSQQDMYTVTIIAKWNTAKTMVTYGISIYNGSKSDTIFPNVLLLAATSNQGTARKTLKTLGNVTVKAGKTWEYNGSSALAEPYQYLGISYTGLSTVTWAAILVGIEVTPGGGEVVSSL